MFDIIYHLSNGEISDKFELPSSGGVIRMTDLAALGHPSNGPAIQEVVDSVRRLNMDRADFLNVKMILLLNPCQYPLSVNPELSKIIFGIFFKKLRLFFFSELN
jgi:hypothetical protein